MKQKLFTFFLALIVSVGTIFASDTQVDGIWYDFDDQNLTASVTYRGFSETAYSNEYQGDVFIPSSVKYDAKNYSVTSIGWAAFYNCSKLTSVTIPKSVTSIGGDAFAYCSSLTSVTIPDSVTSIGKRAFRYCSSMTYITCWAITPPTLGTNIFNEVNKSIPLFVPQNSIAAYKAVTQWKDFTNIKGVGTSVSGKFKIGELYYNLRSNNLTAEVTSENSSSPYWSSAITSATIPDTIDFNGVIYSVTSIGNNAFSGCANLTSVSIGDNVTSIGEGAFSNCSGLSAFHITDIAAWCAVSLGNQYSNPLYYAKNLYLNDELITNLEIPDSVIRVGDYAFEECINLTSVKIPNSVKGIRSNAFLNCFNLKTVTLNSNSIVGSSYMVGNNICTRFGEQVTKYIIGDDVTEIGSNAFAYSTNLSFLELSNSVTSIGWQSFARCAALSEITIPASVKDIDVEAFKQCSIKTIYYQGNLEQWCERQWNAGGISWDYTLYIEGEKINDVTIPASIDSIREGAFAGCDNLTSITIPISVVSIGTSAFCGCDGLTSVSIPNSVTSIEYAAFTGCDSLETIILNSDAVVNFTGGTCYPDGPCISGISNIFDFQVKNIIIGDDVTNIGAKAFESLSNLQSITIGKSVTSIANNAFSGCNNVTSVIWNAKNCNGCNFGSQIESFIFGNEVEVIPASICKGMTQLTNIAIPSSATSIGSEAFSGCAGLTSINIPAHITNIGSEAFNNCTGLTFIIIPQNLTSIANNAFSGCNNVTSVIWNAKNCNGCNFGSQIESFIFGNEVEVIPTSICKGMTQLTNIAIPSSATSIGSEAFSGCAGLTSINIPAHISSIGVDALKACSNLDSLFVEEGNSIYDSRDNCNAIIVSASNTLIFGCKNTIIPNSVTKIGNYAFNGCSSLTSIIVPNNVTNIGDYAFNDCRGLNSVTLSDGMTTIKNNTFNNCTQLASLVIGRNVTNIESNAFFGCPLISVTIRSNAIASKDYTTSANFAHIFGPQVENYILGSNISKIGYYAFHGCGNVKTMTFQSYNVPTFHTSAFNNLKNGTITYVPCGRKEAYDYAFSLGGGMQDIFSTQYVPLKFKITGYVNNETMGSVTEPQTECDYLIAEANYGYHFDHWSDGNTYSRRMIDLTQDTILQAFFEKNSYSIHTESTRPDGGLTYGDTTALYLDTVTITAIVNEHFHFLRWSDGDLNATRKIIITENKTYTAIFEKDKYLVVFLDDDSTELQRDSVEYGAEPRTPANPTKESTAQYEYSFNGWNPTIIEVTQNATYTATYTSTIRSYTVKFLNEDGSEISSVVYQYGQTPVVPSDPTKPATAEYTYTFAGWDKTIVQVQEDQIYRATFNATKNSYTITWLNENGSLIDQTTVEYGVVPTHADPVKTNTAEYTYTFAGWTPTIVSVTGNATYRATFNATKNSYTISWQNEDGSLIDQTTVEYGVVPTHADPVKENTAEYTYTFTGWTPEVVAVTGNATYRATFNATKNSYTITWQNEDGSLIDQTTVEYGVVPTHADPVKENTAEYTYTFTGWTPEVVAVTGNATYRATFSSEVNMYSITTNVVNGEVEGVGVYLYGTEVTLTAIPNDGYAFDQWSDGVKDNPRTIIVLGDAEYTALFTSTESIDDPAAPEKIQKVIIDDKIYILRGDHIYTLTGAEVK